MISCEILKIFKNAYFEEHPRTTDSEPKRRTSDATSVSVASRRRQF